MCRGQGRAFGNRIRDCGLQQQMFVGGKRIVNEALGQTLGLEVIEQPAKPPVRI
jgi:hypothetical protein